MLVIYNLFDILLQFLEVDEMKVRRLRGNFESCEDGYELKVELSFGATEAICLRLNTEYKATTGKHQNEQGQEVQRRTCCIIFMATHIRIILPCALVFFCANASIVCGLCKFKIITY